MSSLYAKYIKEREGKEILELPEGFATYEFLKDHCYIIDIYVVPEFRKSKIASKMADSIAEIARSKGYSKLLGSVRPSASGSSESTKVLMAYGFKLLSSSQDAIFFEKDITI